MGSPVSRIVADIYMEFLEQAAIATVPLEYKPRLWKRYVDNILEVINKEAVKGLTEHLNQIDTTGRQEIYQKHQETWQSEQNKSAITDHINIENHIID